MLFSTSKVVLILFVSTISLITPLCSWEKPSEVDLSVWSCVEPYLIPDDHKVALKINKIFKQNDFRVTESFHTLHEAGFHVTGTDHTLNFRVVKHKDIKGWLFKIYTDDNPQETEWPHFVARCQGALEAKKAIKNQRAEKLFKVPQKYIIPIKDKSPTPYVKKQFILAVEEMDLLAKENNKKAWGTKKDQKEFLNTFWRVVTEAGLSDNFNIYNSPWCHCGMVAFVDTEHFHEWPVHYPNLLIRLKGRNHIHWQSLINRGGP